jgi:peptidoglycan/LPS O-acetylase OafA/YrhL
MFTFALSLAAVLTVIIGFVHSILGEQWLIGPLVSPDRPGGPLVKNAFGARTLRFAWHLTTVAWWGFAAILLIMAYVPETQQPSAILLTIAATLGLTGVIALVTSRGRHLSWPVFLAVAALSAWPVLAGIARV